MIARRPSATPAAVVEAAGQTVLVDRSGVRSPRPSEPPAGLVHVRVGAPAVLGERDAGGNAAARAAMQVLAALPGSVRSRLTAVDAPRPVSVTLRLSGDRTVVWGSAADSATKATVLRTLLRRPAHVYDVSTPTVVTTR